MSVFLIYWPLYLRVTALYFCMRYKKTWSTALEIQEICINDIHILASLCNSLHCKMCTGHMHAYTVIFMNKTIVIVIGLLFVFLSVLSLPSCALLTPALHHIYYWMDMTLFSPGALGFNLEWKCRKMKFSGKLLGYPLNTLVKSPKNPSGGNFFYSRWPPLPLVAYCKSLKS